MKNHAWLRVLPVCLLLLWGVTAHAQSQRTQAASVMGVAPASAEAQLEAQHAAAAQLKAQRKAEAGQAQSPAQARQALDIQEKADIVAAQMKANQGNASFDMATALRSLKRYAIYPLDHYDPTFPIVARTGDEGADRITYNRLKSQLKNQ